MADATARSSGARWSQRWLAEQWQEWQPRTRVSAIESLARFITIATGRGAKTPEGLRVYLYTALAPDSEAVRDAQHEKWMPKNSLTLGDLDRERIADIDRQLGLKLADGSEAKIVSGVDDHSRFCISAHVVARATARPTCDALALAMRRYRLMRHDDRDGSPRSRST